MPIDLQRFVDQYGILGAIVVLMMVGLLTPKWVVDEYRKRELIKDAVLDRLTTAIERLTDQLEARK